jgi:hypothetical protein
MFRTTKRNLAIAGTALAAAAGAGGAYAATSTNSNPRQAYLNDLAHRLGVTPQKLDDALKGAFNDRLSAAVAAGQLTQAQANAIKQRLAQRGVPPMGIGGGALGKHPFGPGRLGRHAKLGAAAKYLGLTPAQLRDQLRSGKSLAQIANQRGKSVSGLKDALQAAAKAKLDKAVSAKRITSAQEQQLLSRLSSRLDAIINHQGLGPRGGPGPMGNGPGIRHFPALPLPPGQQAGPPSVVY